MADKDSRAGKARYDKPEIVEYVNRVHAAHDAALAQAFAVPEGIPQIQVGPSEGRLLTLLVQMVGATKIVEVGTLVGSSAIRSVGYDDAQRILEVRYIDGDVYRYRDVPAFVVEAFRAAPSKGHFVNNVIKPFFDYENAD